MKFIRIIKVVRLLRLFKLKKIFSKFEESLDFTNAITNFYKVIKLAAMILFIAHWVACIWHYVTFNETDDRNWLT